MMPSLVNLSGEGQRMEPARQCNCASLSQRMNVRAPPAVGGGVPSVCVGVWEGPSLSKSVQCVRTEVSRAACM